MSSLTFNNVLSLLNKNSDLRDKLKSYYSENAANWGKKAFATAPPIDPTLAYNWAKSGGTVPTDPTAVASQGFQNYDPVTAAVPADFWSMASQYQQQNAALADASALKNYGLSQGYMNQLANAGEIAKGNDFDRNMQAFQAQQYSPEMTAAIGASKQNQMLQAMQGEAGMLTAVSNAAKNAADMSAQGFRLGMQNYYRA